MRLSASYPLQQIVCPFILVLIQLRFLHYLDILECVQIFLEVLHKHGTSWNT